MPLYVGHKNSGFKAVGNLTENNGVYSGFYAGSDLASSGYLQASQKLPEKMSKFQCFTKFTCTALGGSILSSVQDFKGLADINIASDGSYRVWLSSNGTSYDIAESFKGNYTFVVGSTYYFSFYWNGAAYQTFIKPEGAAEWTNDIYIASTKQPYTKDSVLILGIDQSKPGSPFPGSIDANQTTLYIDGKLWLANDAVKAKDLYLGGQKLAYAFLGTKNSNCITHIPQDINFEIVNGTTPTLYAGSEVWVPYGKAVPALNIGDSLNGGIITAVSWDGNKLFYKVRYGSNISVDITSDPAKLDFTMVVAPSGVLWWYALSFSQDTAPTGFGTYALWYDTAENIVKESSDRGSSWFSYLSLPINIFNMGGVGANKKVKEIYNGFGFIGSTAYVLPGVKVLMADGLNEDGSYKSVERTFDKMVMRTMAFNRDAFYGVVLDGEYTIQGDNYIEAAELPDPAPDGYAFCYRTSDNTLWWTLNNNTWVRKLGVPIGVWTTSTVRISNFNPAKEEAETRALMCYCSYNATQTICNVNNGASWSGTLARGIYYIRAQGAGAGGGGNNAYNAGYGGGSGAGFEGYIYVKSPIEITVNTGVGGTQGTNGTAGGNTSISGIMTLGGGTGGKPGTAGTGGTISITLDDRYEILSTIVRSAGKDGNGTVGGNSVLTNTGGGLNGKGATAPGAGGGGQSGWGSADGGGYYGECLIKCVGVY